MLEILNFLIPSLLSLIALYFSILSFSRDRTFHNENSLYEAKLDAYRAVIRLMTNYLSEVEDLLLPLSDYSQHPSKELMIKLEESGEKADHITYRLKNDLTEYRFLASAAVDQKLDAFLDYLLNTDESIEGPEQYINYSKKAIDDLYLQAEEIAKAMHLEMKIGLLNEQLFKRLSSKSTRFLFIKRQTQVEQL